MALSEADTRAKLIDPAIYARGWLEDMISLTLRGFFSAPVRQSA